MNHLKCYFCAFSVEHHGHYIYYDPRTHTSGHRVINIYDCPREAWLQAKCQSEAGQIVFPQAEACTSAMNDYVWNVL